MGNNIAWTAAILVAVVAAVTTSGAAAGEGRTNYGLTSWDDFWHCTQTEFAAYARQRRGTKIEVLGPGRFAIERPSAMESGSDVPLTLLFEGDSAK